MLTNRAHDTAKGCTIELHLSWRLAELLVALTRHHLEYLCTDT